MKDPDKSAGPAPGAPESNPSSETVVARWAPKIKSLKGSSLEPEWALAVAAAIHAHLLDRLMVAQLPLADLKDLALIFAKMAELDGLPAATAAPPGEEDVVQQARRLLRSGNGVNSDAG